MIKDAPLEVRKVSNGFIVQPSVAFGNRNTIENDIFVFEDFYKMNNWMAEHFGASSEPISIDPDWLIKNHGNN